MMNGERKLCWEGWGAKEVEIQTMKVGVAGMTQETKTATYTNLSEGGIVYSVDYSTDPPTGTKTVNPIVKSLEGKDAKKMGEDILVQMGGVRTGTKELLGKLCDEWKIKATGTTMYSWEGVILKSVTDMMGMKTIEEAKNISETCDENVDPPTNIRWEDKRKEMEDMMKRMKGL
jgi:hypothetical protein